MTTLWFERAAGEHAATNDEDPSMVLLGSGAPDWVRLPEELGGMKLRVFSRASAEEAILVRIDDKLSRIARGQEFGGDDTVLDLVGYLVLLRVLRIQQKRAAK